MTSNDTTSEHFRDAVEHMEKMLGIYRETRDPLDKIFEGTSVERRFFTPIEDLVELLQGAKIRIPFQVGDDQKEYATGNRRISALKPFKDAGGLPYGPNGERPLDAFRNNGHRLPLAGKITVTSGYKKRPPPQPGASKYHRAIDFRAKIGTDVFASQAGEVIFAGKFTNSETRAVIIKSGNIYHRYLHLKKDGIVVKRGQEIVRGQFLGASGDTGSPGKPHLHYERGIGLNERGKVKTPIRIHYYPDHLAPETQASQPFDNQLP